MRIHGRSATKQGEEKGGVKGDGGGIERASVLSRGDGAARGACDGDAGSARVLRRGKAEGVQQTAVSPPASGAKVHWADSLSFLPFAREESQ